MYSIMLKATYVESYQCTNSCTVTDS